MATGLAHESKNALQRIQSSINRLNRRIGENKDLIKITKDIEQASDDIKELIRNGTVKQVKGRIGCCLRKYIIFPNDSHKYAYDDNTLITSTLKQ